MPESPSPPRRTPTRGTDPTLCRIQFGYLFSVVAARANGPRTVPVRSTWPDRGALENLSVLGPDHPLRTGTVRGPTQRGVPTGLNGYDAEQSDRDGRTPREPRQAPG